MAKKAKGKLSNPKDKDGFKATRKQVKQASRGDRKLIASLSGMSDG